MASFAGPCVQISHIKALLLGFLVSSQLIVFETVVICSVRHHRFPDNIPSFLKEPRLLVSVPEPRVP